MCAVFDMGSIGGWLEGEVWGLVLVLVQAAIGYIQAYDRLYACLGLNSVGITCVRMYSYVISWAYGPM